MQDLETRIKAERSVENSAFSSGFETLNKSLKAVFSLLVAVMMLVYDRKLANKTAFLRGSYMAAAMLLSLAVCYAVGTAWYMVYAGTSFVAALSLTALPFIPGDLAKIVLCAVLALSLRPRIRKILLRK